MGAFQAMADAGAGRPVDARFHGMLSKFKRKDGSRPFTNLTAKGQKTASLQTIEAGRPQIPADATGSRPTGASGNQATTLLGDAVPGNGQATGQSLVKKRSGSTAGLTLLG